ncbi:MAG: TIM barrel protein [Paludibacter sp.]|nr:TIM barrel protein [Paludibacter sp.]MDD4428801.1 TIM barrel protein [Paludibacter sp.]
MGFFVAFPMHLLAHNKNVFDICIAKKINLELQLDAQVLDDLEISYHSFLSGEFNKAGICCSIHLPFFDICPGSPDKLIRTASRERLIQALEVAKIYNPVHLVAHSGYQEHYGDCFSEWSLHSVATWTDVLTLWPDHPVVYFENVYARDPGVMQDFLSEMSPYSCKFCFDVGHWYSFARGANSKNLSLWLQKLGPILGHIHLHDNCGFGDHHLGLGCGTIPWEEVFSSLEIMDIEPSVTLEPRTFMDFHESLIFMQEHFSWFSRLGISKKYLADMMEEGFPSSF